MDLGQDTHATLTSVTVDPDAKANYTGSGKNRRRNGRRCRSGSHAPRQDFYERNSPITADSAEFSVVELDAGHLVGFGGLFDITRAMTATMFVGIGDPARRKRGFGTEAARLICEYGFFFRSLHSIKVEAHAYNVEARRLYGRLGFKTVGRLRGANLLNNRRYDEVIMDLLHCDLELKHVGRFQSLENNGG